MSQQNEGLKAFYAGEDLQIFRRVKLSAGAGDTVEYADQADSDGYIGVTQDTVLEGGHITVRLKTQGKTFKVEAGEAISAGAALYAADDGKVGDTVSGNQIGIALEASIADGEIIEMLPV